jgi:hypothetical protein
MIIPGDRRRLPQCVQATDKVVSCADWCYGVPEAEPPNHVCYPVIVGSIEHYIAAHLGLEELRVGFQLSWPWQLGVHELRTWYEEQDARLDRLSVYPYVSPEFHQRWDEVFGYGPPPSQDDERLRLFDDFPAERVAAFQRWSYEMVAPTPPTPSVFGAPPITTREERWLGFVVHRPVGDSTLWMLGLLGRPTAEEFHGENWFKWIHPVLQVESHAVKAGLDALTKQSKALLKWYNQTVLGELARKGRPVGSKEYWLGQDDFLAAVRAAVRAIQQGGDTVTQKRLAEYLWVQRTRVIRPLSEGADPERQFKRDRIDYGFPTWADLKEFLGI